MFEVLVSLNEDSSKGQPLQQKPSLVLCNTISARLVLIAANPGSLLHISRCQMMLRDNLGFTPANSLFAYGLKSR